jgi:hypothetical protein
MWAGLWGWLSGRQLMHNLAEQPWITESGSADHHTIATGYLQHATGVGGSSHIAIPNHRYTGHSLFDLPNHIPIGMTGKPLLGKTGMNRNSLRPNLLGSASKRECGHHPIIEPSTDFDRYGDIHCFNHGLDYGCCGTNIA